MAQISAVDQDTGEVLETLPATLILDPSSRRKMQSPPGAGGQKVQWVVSSFPLHLDDDEDDDVGQQTAR